MDPRVGPMSPGAGPVSQGGPSSGTAPALLPTLLPGSCRDVLGCTWAMFLTWVTELQPLLRLWTGHWTRDWSLPPSSGLWLRTSSDAHQGGSESFSERWGGYERIGFSFVFLVLILHCSSTDPPTRCWKGGAGPEPGIQGQGSLPLPLKCPKSLTDKHSQARPLSRNPTPCCAPVLRPGFAGVQVGVAEGTERVWCSPSQGTRLELSPNVLNGL